MARRRLKKKFKKKINRAVRRFSAFTMALILMTVLLSLESFSSHAEEIEDASADTLTIVELGETESIVTEETTDVISDGTEGSESESGDVVEGESGEAIEDESEEISEEVSEGANEEISEEVSEDISEELSEDNSEEIGEDESEEIGEDESEEISKENSEEVSEEVSEETSEKGKEKKSKEKEKKDKDTKAKKKKTITYEVGDVITFGQYEQDGNYDNGPEDIEWVILSIDEEKALVVSKYALDCQPYNTEYVDVTWENCSLRAWLNNDFLNAAFSEEEQEHIPEVTLANEDNSYYGTEGGNETTDRVFCLSENEVKDLIGYTDYDDEHHYGFSPNLLVEPTQYASNNGAVAGKITKAKYEDLRDKGYDSDIINQSYAFWWLLSPGSTGKNVCGVGFDGCAGAYYNISAGYSFIAVRPAVFMELSAMKKTDKKDKNTSSALSTEENEDVLGQGIELNDVELEDAIVDEAESEEIIVDENDSEEIMIEDTNAELEEEELNLEESNDEESNDKVAGNEESEIEEPTTEGAEGEDSEDEDSEDAYHEDVYLEKNTLEEMNSEDAKPEENNSLGKCFDEETEI